VAPAEAFVLMTLSREPKGDPDLLDQIASLRPRLSDVPVALSNPDQLPTADASSTEETADSGSQPTDVGDPALRTAMFGRYAAQISARIERRWARPRSPVHEISLGRAPLPSAALIKQSDVFKCRVQIRQDDYARVQEVLLLECNGSEAWRRSLVMAINQSSPLPAAPAPEVFARAITLTFESHTFREGDDPDGYEVMKPGQTAQAEVGQTWVTRPDDTRRIGRGSP
jgi:hypothetical protein